MGISKAQWYIKDQVIYCVNIGELTGDDFRDVDSQIKQLLREAADNNSSTVHIIVDNEQMTSLPSILELEGGQILKYFSEPNCGTTLVVAKKNNPFLTVLSKLLTSVMGKQLFMARDMESALRELHRLEPDVEQFPDIEHMRSTL